MYKEIIIREKDMTDVAIDSIFCPHCGSEMIRNPMGNPYTIHGVEYICFNCDATEIRSPQTEEERM